MAERHKLSLLVILALLVGLASGFLLGKGEIARAPETSSVETAPVTGTVSVMVDYGDGTVKTYTGLAADGREPLIGILERTLKGAGVAFETQDYKELGALVIKIGNKKNGAGSRYWQYWVNNVRPPVGASSYIPRAGDVIEWKFVPDQGL